MLPNTRKERPVLSRLSDKVQVVVCIHLDVCGGGHNGLLSFNEAAELPSFSHSSDMF